MNNEIKGFFLSAFSLPLLLGVSGFISINRIDKLEKRVEALERSGTAAVRS